MQQAPASNEKKHKIIVHSLTPAPFSAFLSRDFEKKSAKLPMVSPLCVWGSEKCGTSADALA
jgi:hypothetical protein